MADNSRLNAAAQRQADRMAQRLKAQVPASTSTERRVTRQAMTRLTDGGVRSN